MSSILAGSPSIHHIRAAMVFANDLRQVLPITQTVPAALAGLLLPVSAGVAVVGNEFIQLLVQEFLTEDARLLHTVHRTGHYARLHVKDEQPFFFLVLALQEERRLHLEGLGAVHLREGQFNFIYAPRFIVTTLHEAGREYITLSLHYSLTILDAWAPYFPSLSAFLAKVQAGVPAVWLEGNAWMTQDILDGIHRLLHTSREIAGFPLYFNLMARSLLFQVLQQSLQQQPVSPYTHNDISGIHSARDMIGKNIRHHFRIPEIARRIGMNEFKLKTGFRELFGNGVYGYLQSVRMQEALRLLNDTHLNIRQIADKTGYRSVNSFIKAFRKKFGMTPGEYRDKH